MKSIDLVRLKVVKEKDIPYYIKPIRTPNNAMELCRLLLSNRDREKVVVICLDSLNMPMNIHLVSIGTLNSSLVHPREVFKIAVKSNVNSINNY